MSIEDFHLDASSCDHDYIFFQNRNYCTNFLPEKTDFIIPANEPIIIFSDSILVSEFASGLLLKYAINDVDGQLETETQSTKKIFFCHKYFSGQKLLKFASSF